MEPSGFLRKELVAIFWTYRRHSPIYKQRTFMSPQSLSKFCLRTMPKDEQPVSPAKVGRTVVNKVTYRLSSAARPYFLKFGGYRFKEFPSLLER
jgi:hypothetical protein